MGDFGWGGAAGTLASSPLESDVKRYGQLKCKRLAQRKIVRQETDIRREKVKGGAVSRGGGVV